MSTEEMSVVKFGMCIGRREPSTDAVGGLKLRASVRGSGSPLLILNGLGGDLDMLDEIRAALNCQTIAVDLPGTGQSPTQPYPLSIPHLARLMWRTLDQLGVQRVDLLGVSLGGALAQQMSLSRPDRVERLVLVSTSWGAGLIPGRPAAWMALVSSARFYRRGHYERLARTLFGGRTAREPQLAQAYGKMRRNNPPSLVGYVWQLCAGATWTTLPLLHRIIAPTLVLTGDDDPLIRPVNSRVLAHRIPYAQLRIVRGGGHLMLLDDVAQTAPIINDFLASNSFDDRR